VAKYLHEIQPHAAGATSDQFNRLVDECKRYGREHNPTYPHTQAMIDASVMLERAEGAGLRVAEPATYVCEGWWHLNVKDGRVHDHPENPGGGWSSASHRLCERVFTKREAP